MNNPAPQQLHIEPLDGYTPEVGRWLWALEDTRQRTRRSLEGISPALIDWGAPYGDNTIGTLLYHIAAIEVSWLYSEILAQAFPSQIETLFPYPVRDDNGRLFAVAGVSLADHLHRLDATRTALLEAFRQINDTDFLTPREFEAYHVTPQWVIHHLMQHEAEHRGQIMTLRIHAENT